MFMRIKGFAGSFAVASYDLGVGIGMPSSDYEVLIFLPEVEALTGLKRSSIYLRLKKNSPYADERFPRPVS